MMERNGNMQRKKLLIIIITSCMCLLSVDAFANKARAIERMIKGSEKTFKNQKRWAPIYAAGTKYINKEKIEKKDSLYLDSTKINEFYRNHPIQSQKPFPPQNLAPYNDNTFDDNFVNRNDFELNNDPIMQQKDADTLEQAKTAEKNFNSDNSIAKDTIKITPPNNPAENKMHLHWILLFGLVFFILFIIYSIFKTSKKGGSK